MREREREVSVPQFVSTHVVLIRESVSDVLISHRLCAQTVRPKSLFEIHQEEAKKAQKSGTKKEVKEKDFLAGGWDRSEMESRGALNPKEAKKMLTDSMGLDGRFGPSSFQ